jgi:hypothetical protein
LQPGRRAMGVIGPRYHKTWMDDDHDDEGKTHIEHRKSVPSMKNTMIIYAHIGVITMIEQTI